MNVKVINISGHFPLSLSSKPLFQAEFESGLLKQVKSVQMFLFGEVRDIVVLLVIQNQTNYVFNIALKCPKAIGQKRSSNCMWRLLLWLVSACNFCCQVVENCK